MLAAFFLRGHSTGESSPRANKLALAFSAKSGLILLSRACIPHRRCEIDEVGKISVFPSDEKWSHWAALAFL
jgi:hypothetical protein